MPELEPTRCYSCMRVADNRQNADDGTCPLCGKPLRPARQQGNLAPGSLLKRRYLVGTVLGQGGFGITYVGFDTVLNVRVAVKEYYPANSARGEATEVPVLGGDSAQRSSDGDKLRFLREARILAFLDKTDGVVSVKDYFEENETAYIIMEYLDGLDLQMLLQTRGCLSADEAFKRMEPVIDALALVHDEGVIHRDVSPQNIKVLADGTFKLMDFGSAKSIDPQNPQTMTITLKPGYAPEEQYRSKGIQGPWSDIYALCATLYKCITGITPEDSFQRMCSDDEAVRWPSSLGIEISPVQEAAIKKGMALKPKDRFQSIAELKAFMRGGEGSLTELADADVAARAVVIGAEVAAAARPAKARQVYAPEVERDIVTLQGPEAEAFAAGEGAASSAGADATDAVDAAGEEHTAGKQKQRGGKLRWTLIALVAAALIVAAVIAAGVILRPGDEAQTDSAAVESLPMASTSGYSGSYDAKSHGISVDTGGQDALVLYSLEPLSYEAYKTAREAGVAYAQTESPQCSDAGATTVNYMIVYDVDSSAPRCYIGSEEIRITKAKQKITLGANSYSKKMGDAPFSLKAKAKGELSYASSDADVATVDSSGRVTVKGVGTAIITVQASAAANFKAAKARVKLKVSAPYGGASSSPSAGYTSGSSTQSGSSSSTGRGSGGGQSSSSKGGGTVKIDGWV